MKYSILVMLIILFFGINKVDAQHGSAPFNSPSLYLSNEKADDESSEGRFGRMFALNENLKPHPSPIYDLLRLGRNNGPMVEDENKKIGDSTTPAGITFLGQFIDHDITFDTSSRLDQPVMASNVENMRTSNLDLDSVYGGGPEKNPYLYDLPKLVVGEKLGKNRYDLARFNKRALIGDPRNDENVIISQLQAAFIAFHNAIADQITRETNANPKLSLTEMEVFERARDHVIHYYHRLIIEDFLPNVIGVDLTKEIRTDGRKFYFKDGFYSKKNNRIRRPYIPIEFSVAAYRFGHSQVRQTYILNKGGKEVPLFDPDPKKGLVGFKPITKDNLVDWHFFFPIAGSESKLQKARKIDTKLPKHLFTLNEVGVVPANALGSLAARNLNRGRVFRLPSGQDLAKLMGLKELDVDETVKNTLAVDSTPLWYYILQEAMLQQVEKQHHMVILTAFESKNARFSKGGDILGPVGGRIVGEVLIGLIDHYREFTGKGLDFVPSLATEIETVNTGKHGQRFHMQNLLRFSGLIK